jgi:hypothetical protein
MIAARFDPAASMTARMSSIRVSRSGMPAPRSERPVPRLSNRISRENEASERKKSAGGPSHAYSRAESTQPLTNTRSNGPSPTVAYAMLVSPLFAYRTSGAFMKAVCAASPPHTSAGRRRFTVNAADGVRVTASGWPHTLRCLAASSRADTRRCPGHPESEVIDFSTSRRDYPRVRPCRWRSRLKDRPVPK